MQETFVSHEIFFDIIVQETLSLIQQIFVDKVDLLVHTCDIKNKKMRQYLLLKETVKLHQLSTLFQINSEIYLKEFRKLFYILL